MFSNCSLDKNENIWIILNSYDIVIIKYINFVYLTPKNKVYSEIVITKGL